MDQQTLYPLRWFASVRGPLSAQMPCAQLLTLLSGETATYVVLERFDKYLYAFRLRELIDALRGKPDSTTVEDALQLHEDQSSATVWSDHPRPARGPILARPFTARVVVVDRWGTIAAVGEPVALRSAPPKRGDVVAANGGTPAAAPPEGTSVTRYPSIKPDRPAVAGSDLTITVDLSREQRDRITQGEAVSIQAPSGWQELGVSVTLFSDYLTFAEDADSGEIIVRRDAPSVPFTTKATVHDDAFALRSFLVRADFYYEGRWSGTATREIPIDRRQPAAVAAPAAESTPAGIAIDELAEAPVLTVRISQLSRRGNLHWVLTIPRQHRTVPGLPRRLEGDTDVGANIAEFAQNLFEAAASLVAGEHTAILEGIGEQIYERAPPAFKQAYWALRKAVGTDFPIQFVSDDPYIPWELMRPVSDGMIADILAVAHPVARMLCSYEGDMAPRIARGTIVTIAPKYEQRRALVHAQEESQQLQTKYQAEPVGGTQALVRKLLEEPAEDSHISVVHFAGHGTFPFGNPTASVINLEDGDMRVAQVRRREVVLGEKSQPLVVFNACEVGGAAAVLGTVGGWADAFLYRRFGGFLAPLWAVYDLDAFVITSALLDRVLNQNQTIGEALRAVRAERGAESPTFYSYLYYGDVMARMS